MPSGWRDFQCIQAWLTWNIKVHANTSADECSNDSQEIDIEELFWRLVVLAVDFGELSSYTDLTALRKD